jgi:UrcA family protein
MKRASSLALIAAALAVTPVGAQAQQQERRVVTVTHDDLDLTTEAGRDELERRIDRAARDVCGMEERVTGSRLPPSSVKRCYKQAKRQIGERFAQIMETGARGG